VVANCTGYVQIKSDDESALMNAVGTVGPISFSFDASDNAFRVNTHIT